MLSVKRQGEKHGKGEGNSGAKRGTEKVKEIQELRERHGKGGGHSGAKRGTEKVKDIQELEV